MTHEHESHHAPDRIDRAFKWGFGGFLLIALFFLLAEHRAHVFGLLPWLLLLACPLMHFFGHGHHGRHGHSHAPEQPPSAKPGKEN
jgi:hypothetical protein